MTFLLYGATGYTGELVAREAAQQGLRPILAGRNERALKALAQELGFDYRVFSLDDSALLDAGLAEVELVLNCAGPFAVTSGKLVQACIRTGTHYLDLAGEVPEFAALEQLDAAAQAANILLLPGVGFGIVPSDCLALHVKNRLPAATQLALAFYAQGGASRGTLLTLLHDVPRGGVVRQQGKLVAVQAGSESRRIAFGDQGETARIAAANPWRGDIFTAYYSTGIPTIKTYTVFPTALRIAMGLAPVRAVLGYASVQRFLAKQLQGQPAGPSAQERAQGRTYLWAEARDAAGNTATSRLVGPEAYVYTIITALLIVKRVLEEPIQSGFHTPAQLYGADFLLELPGVERTDL